MRNLSWQLEFAFTLVLRREDLWQSLYVSFSNTTLPRNKSSTRWRSNSLIFAGREAGNTIVWQCRFDSLGAAEIALKKIDASAEHTELAAKQHPLFQQSWVEFYEVLDF